MLTVENYGLYQGEGTTKPTLNKQQKDNEKTMNKQQKDIERYTKEEVNKNREEEKEREEEIPVLSPLPELDGFRKFFLNQYGEVADRTWIESCDIKETADGVFIQVLDDFRKSCIETKFKDSIGLLYKKKVEVIEKGG